MKLRLFSLVSLTAFTSLIIATRASALDLYNPNKTYGDEKVTIDDSSSRCLTADFKKLHDAALALAEKDINARKNADGTIPATIQKAVDDYRKELDTAWQAMHEPYCGFGAFGTSAAKKSFQKTLDRGRTTFLAAVKTAPTRTVTTTKTEPASTPATPALPATASAKASVALTHNWRRGQRSNEIVEAQKILAAKGFMDANLATGYYGTITEQAVYAFQLKMKLVTSKSSPGAGQIGPKTRAALVK